MSQTTIQLFTVSVAALAASFSAFFAWRASNAAKNNLTFQLFFNMQMEYRTPRMLHAVMTLWNFYQTCNPKELIERYENILAEDRQRIGNMPEAERIEAQACTLHSQRRLVSQFYQIMARMYVNKILSGKLVYSVWSEADLKIIPQIIIPIENRLLQKLSDAPVSLIGRDHPLAKLYEDSKEYC